jgi:hypothetical protein
VYVPTLLLAHDDLTEIERLSQSFYNEVEDIAVSVSRVADRWHEDDEVPENPPTLEQIGVLFVLAEMVKTQANQLEREAQRIVGKLTMLDEVRLSGQAKTRAN